MQSEDRVRLWLVDRSYANDGASVVLTYATPDGSSRLRSEQGLGGRDADHPVAAAIDARPGSVEAVDSQDERVELATAAR